MKMMYNFIKYEPFPDIRNFYLLSLNDKPISLFFDSDVSYTIDLTNAKFLPKSGLLLCRYLEKICKGKTMLDIGTGYTAILSRHAIAHGAKHVDAIDIDDGVIHYLQKSTKPSSLSVFKSNNFEKLTGKKYDLIVSNPAQMPVTSSLTSLHDTGGKTGFENIEQILNQAPDYLEQGGRLILLVFGFIGVNTITSPNHKCIFDIIQNTSLEVEVTDRYLVKIRPNGAISQNLDVIHQLYPNYKFIHMNDEIYNEIYVIQCKKKEDIK